MLTKIFNALHTARHYPYRARSKQLILETKIEVALGAVVLGGVFGAVSYNHEAAKQGQIPLAFSEIAQIKRDSDTVAPLTLYYASVNDTLMQVFEANNISYNAFGQDNRHFARELEYKVDRAFRIHTQIREYAMSVPDRARNARHSIAPMTAAARDIQSAIGALNAAWDDDHDDKYRTEYYTERECSTGKDPVCRDVTKSRQVYDYTIHTYTYDRAQGERAAQLLQDFMRNHPDLKIDEYLILAKATNAENELAMWQSRRLLPDFKELTPEDYLRLANTFATGSTYTTLTPSIWTAHKSLSDATPKWVEAAPRARSDRYRTYSRIDSGPASFQLAEAALSYATTLSTDINRIDSGMAAAEGGIPALHRTILEYIAVTLDKKPGDADDLRDQVMDQAREIYAANYAGGFDTTPSEWGMVVLWAVLGLMAGGGLGLGADRIIDRYCAKRGINHPRPSWQEHMKKPMSTRVVF